jgi:hypothetical protein
LHLSNYSIRSNSSATSQLTLFRFDNMKFTTTTLLSALLCAEATLAAVPAERRAARSLARRNGRARRSGTLKQTVIEHATVESNWGGAIIEGSGFTAASATANVPKGAGGSSAAGSAWVGIDGATCETAILQTGFDWYGDGTYDAWYEWYPLDAGKCFDPHLRRDGESW